MKHIPGMSENDATIYFLTYKNLLQDVDSQSSGQQSAFSKENTKDIPLQNYQVDVRCFGLYIAL